MTLKVRVSASVCRMIAFARVDGMSLILGVHAGSGEMRPWLSVFSPPQSVQLLPRALGQDIPSFFALSCTTWNVYHKKVGGVGKDPRRRKYRYDI